jgi:predicted CXXCH cytochrome family protein
MPNCNSCHDKDEPHFAGDNCQDCHAGHDPLGHDLSKAKNANPACLACHEETKDSFAVAPSAHAEQGCNSCHPQHGKAQQCLDCHDPHEKGQANADCRTCHSVAHAPTAVAFETELPKKFCRSCHAEQVDALAASQEAHNELSCVACHGGEHGSKLECSSCHEPPHDPGLHEKFPDCMTCHGDPHDLADWRTGDASEQMKSVGQPATKKAKDSTSSADADSEGER